MRVAAVQFRGDRADLDGRRAALARWVWGAGPGTDVVVCPELAVSGYVFEDPTDAGRVAEAPTGPTFQALAPVARALGTFVVCGFVERDQDRLFNSAMVIDPAGELAFVYRKTLLYELDEHWATPGDSGYATFVTDRGDFTVGICMDLNDPGMIGFVERSAPRVLAFPTNWLEEGSDVWTYWAWRMDTTRTALVAANTWGEERGVAFSGRSAILQRRERTGGRRWWVLAAGEQTGDALLHAELDAPRPTPADLVSS